MLSEGLNRDVQTLLALSFCGFFTPYSLRASHTIGGAASGWRERLPASGAGLFLSHVPGDLYIQRRISRQHSITKPFAIERTGYELGAGAIQNDAGAAVTVAALFLDELTRISCLPLRHADHIIVLDSIVPLPFSK